MKGAITAALVLVVVGVPSAVFAGVEVDPDEAQPRLHMKVVKRTENGGPGTTQPAVSKPAEKPQVSLDCDPTQAAISCEPAPGALVQGQPDDLTEADILRAVREIGLPSLEVQIQPGEETLVNIETIFYTRPQPFERSITLLGFDIDLVADPVRYSWVHDDGTVSTTSRPGKPYPAMDVTHRYREPADDVHPRVDVTYRVRYRVDGGAWQTIGQTLQASGPVAELDVREAAPVLTRP
jgi:hypothetical protein